MPFPRKSLASAAFVALLLLSCVRIVSTYRVFNHTIDEPAHIACGLEWWQNHEYTFEYQHPPLSRIFMAAGPWLLGAPNIAAKADLLTLNPLVLYNSQSYYATLASARAGILPFFVLASIVVFVWSRRLYGPWAGVASAALFMLLPAVLGHAGLATTDASLMAALPLSLYAFDLWLQSPTRTRSVFFGLALAMGVVSKLSFLLFFPVCAAVIVLFRWRSIRSNWRALVMVNLSIVVVCAFLASWGVYRFHLTPVPLGEIYLGIGELRQHYVTGHRSFLLGEVRTDGWWYFFPVVLFFKTPLAFWLLLAAAVAILRRSLSSSALPLFCAAALLLSVLPSRINIGVRHILPIYALLAIPAGFAAVHLVRHTRRHLRAAGYGLLAWMFLASAFAHPDYFAYFNELARGRPERIRVDSDLDWGQDIERLARRLAVLGVDHPIGIGMFASVDPARHGLKSYPVSPWKPTTGLVALSATERMMSLAVRRQREGQIPWEWLDRYEPIERIGNSILLYYIPKD